MEFNDKKCFSEEHKEIKAIVFCQECNEYLCNKCENLHLKLFKNHHCFNLDKTIDEIFTGFCKEKNHKEKLEYFCKDHNILCCDSCIIKIKNKDKGQHKDCEICFIEDIKEEKINKLNENIKILEDLSINFNESLNKLKFVIEKINTNKEELKLEIQKIFTKIRSTVNEREDELLLEIDKKYEENFLKEDIIKKSEKLPNKIRSSLEKGNLIKNELNNENKLNSIINDCLDIENNIKNINIISEAIKKSNISMNLKIQFFPKEEKIDKFLESLKSFGKISKFGQIDSKIINSDENELIINWIPNNINISFSLLYRMSEDGNEFTTFHNKCDNKFPLLFIAKAQNGNKFGGYTSIGWNTSNQYIIDTKSFLFSIDKKKKYAIQDNSATIGCYSYRGIDFHNDCYFYQTNMTLCYSNGNHSYLKGIGKVLGDNNQKDTFIVEEVEIFKINDK